MRIKTNRKADEDTKSLALALYFASRGKGTLHRTSLSHPDTLPTTSVTTKYVGESKLYCSPARVLLSGLGSDELLGGYSRHRVAFNKGGWLSLVNEVRSAILGVTHDRWTDASFSA
jgi:asparagine synthetase B (glutamine-hydrolysing)